MAVDDGTPSVPRAVLAGVISLLVAFVLGAGVYFLGLWVPNVSAAASFQAGVAAGVGFGIAAGKYLLSYPS
ncbi:MAG: hypothetical protein ABEI99_03975 [Halobaculum sp.]